MTPTSELASIAGTLVDEEEPGLLLAAVETYFRRCGEIAGAPSSRATQLAEGVAISPENAARCTLDVMRTAAFVRGVGAALEALRKRSPKRPLRVLYAGCGPFAPLGILPMARWPHAPDEWLFVDMHADALAQTRRLLRHWRLSQRTVCFLCADASHLPLRDWRPDLAVAEVMQRSLAKEPQLAVSAAVAAALAPGGILVPQSIEVHLALAALSREFQLDATATESSRPRVRQGLGRLLRIDQESAPELLARARREGRLELPRLVVDRVDGPDMTAILRTSIEIFGPHRLGDYDSGLTVPEVLRHLGPAHDGDAFVARYELGPSPRLRVERAAQPTPEPETKPDPELDEGDPSLGVPPPLG